MKFKVQKTETWWGEGFQFTTGTCVIQWHGEIESIVIYKSMDDVKKIHKEHVKEE